MKGEFTAIIEAAPEGGFWALYPEVPGANGQGETVEEAKNSLRDAIEMILEDRMIARVIVLMLLACALGAQEVRISVDGNARIGPFKPIWAYFGYDEPNYTYMKDGKKLLSQSRPPTAIFAANDQTALGIVAAAQTIGLRIPRDLSLVGFDDIPQAGQIHPPLTTVRQPMEQMGRSAVNTLLALLAGIEAASPVISLPTELVVRASTAPPRRAPRVRK